MSGRDRTPKTDGRVWIPGGEYTMGSDHSVARPDERPPHRVRGGSFLCNDEYCSSYRPSARMGCSTDTGMSHVGFRCVVSANQN